MRILFLVPYPLHVSPSQRFRFEQYLTVLKNKGIEFKVCPFLTDKGWADLYRKEKLVQNYWHLFYGLISRLFHLFEAKSADFVFIHREASPIGPPIIEWLLGRVFRKKIIYDFDDAIWLTDNNNESMFERTLRFRQKVSSLCTWSCSVSCGNEYLRQFAAQFNTHTKLNPTTIDTENLHNPTLYQAQNNKNKITIGWTGSHSTLKYLYLLHEVLQHLQLKFPHVDLLVIANKKPEISLPRLIFKQWTKESEITDLLMADIGIMPLSDDEWAKGKCGFKILQYMALEIPPVASSVGVNTTIIQNDVNGYLCDTNKAWETTLEKLIADVSLRKRIGKKGRQNVIDHYSVSSNSANFLSLFE